ncbi:MAG: hypothetical protein H7Y16_07535 [Candidatus Parcubacteria bacterium]|nr:hypothetical protein [Burkholderiales bacterium]
MSDKFTSEASDTERLMGMIMALGGEVFVLKAQVQRMALALAKAGAVGEAALEAAGTSEEFQAWLPREEKAFGRSLLRPFTHPDVGSDATDLLSGSRPSARRKP